MHIKIFFLTSFCVSKSKYISLTSKENYPTQRLINARTICDFWDKIYKLKTER